MIRDLRRADAAEVYRLMKDNFPEEEALLGTDPEGFLKVVRRVYRWDTQLLIRLAALFGRPVYRFLAVEEDGHIVGTTIVTFPERSGYVSSVAVDPAYRRRGLARALLERSREIAARAGKRYVALDVLAHNTPARTLYERIGYRPLRETSMMAREPGVSLGGQTSSPSIRPFRKSDARPLVELARRSTPPEVEEVLPMRESYLAPATFVARILESESAAWVVDRGHGPEAHVGASRSAFGATAHLSSPIVSESLDDATTAELLRTAIRWSLAPGPRRVLTQVPVANERSRSALRAQGFQDALSLWTLYRPAA
jgi:[ribosomal protein S18]-alanine N-acetyltransferase